MGGLFPEPTSFSVQLPQALRLGLFCGQRVCQLGGCTMVSEGLLYTDGRSGRLGERGAAVPKLGGVAAEVRGPCGGWEPADRQSICSHKWWWLSCLYRHMWSEITTFAKHGDSWSLLGLQKFCTFNI